VPDFEADDPAVAGFDADDPPVAGFDADDCPVPVVAVALSAVALSAVVVAVALDPLEQLDRAMAATAHAPRSPPYP